MKQITPTIRIAASALLGLILWCGMITNAAVPDISRPLRDELTGNEIKDGVRNLVICIHGWNNPKQLNRHVESGEWKHLVQQVRSSLQSGSPEAWSLLLYRWEEDAYTGVWSWGIPPTVALPQATQAAINAREHGESLGPRLPRTLRRVHFIALSAGAWAARQAADWLLKNRPYVIAQITLLDPFIPEAVAPASGLLSVGAMSAMAGHSAKDRIAFLENYYADDIPPGIPTSGIPAAPTFGTQSEFEWGTKGTNLQVEWTLAIPPYRMPTGINAYYDWHSGPIQFYADSVQLSLNPSAAVPLRHAGLPYDAAQVGWFRSLFSAQSSMPRFSTQPTAPGTVTSGQTVTLSAAVLRADRCQWFKDEQQISATSSSYSFTASQATAGEYVLRATGPFGWSLMRTMVGISWNGAVP